MKLRSVIICSFWIIAGTILFLKGYYYESGSICFWLAIASLCWSSVQTVTGGRAWHLFGWFHLHLVPLFLIAHVAGCRFGFWFYEGTYLVVIPQSVPLIGGIPLFEFVFYSVFTTAVFGLYCAFATFFTKTKAPTRNLLFVRIATILLWGATVLLLLFKPNPSRTSLPIWFILMAGSSVPFSCAILGLPPFSRWMPFVEQTCSKNYFIALFLFILPIMAFWELSAIRLGLWVYNRSMLLSFIAPLSRDGSRVWPVDMLFGHTNIAIIVFLTTLYRNITNAGAPKV